MAPRATNGLLGQRSSRAYDLKGLISLALLALGCSDRLDLGSDLLWAAGHESGDLSEWTSGAGGDVRLPSEESTVTASSAYARRGRGSILLSNPADWDNQDEGPELCHAAGELADAY